MRTNIEIDDELMKKALALSGLPTKRAVVEAALKTLIRLQSQHSLLELRGKIEWDGDVDALRVDRLKPKK